MVKKYSIAIDGPNASGKSTVAKIIAKKLNYLYIDTGAMYRAFTYYVLKRGVDPKNEKECVKLIPEVEISFNDLYHVTVNNEDVNKEIRDNEVANNVSYIASYKDIRLFLVSLQRKLAEKQSVVMDGRDIGTYVLENADLKIYQIASAEERAKRRYLENKEKGIKTTLKDCLDNINKRDFIDSNRSFCPLHPAKDSVAIDTTNMSIDEVCNAILLLAKERGLH